MIPEKISLSHGSGGAQTHELIRGLFLKKLGNPILKELSDSARIDYKENIAFTTDSFVISPLIFPGGDIGKLSVCGTVNDLVMMGARPEYLSLAVIAEEGLDYRLLEKIVTSISLAAKEAGVSFVTGDFKVVEKNACDKIFINTSGIGRIVYKKKLCTGNIKAGDRVILTGHIGRHGLAVLSTRKNLDLGLGIKSDCAALNGLLLPILEKTASIKFMRDPTRGGVGTTLNEIALSSNLGILIDERSLPVSPAVRAATELLGIDPIYLANEGAAVLIVERKSSIKVLKMLKRHILGKNARIIGEIVKKPKGKVILNTCLGTQRIIDMLSSDPLPRIC